MEFPALKKYQQHITIALILCLMAVALILRAVPVIVTRDQAFFPIYDTDTWYNLRQIEVMVHNFPQYNWFDPMTAYPAGKNIDWGPGLPFITTVFCILTGASTRNEIITASGFIPPLMAALMVPVMYALGSRISDWKTGIAAAGLISFGSFLYFTYSSFGMIDHHIAEVLLSTLFILVYVSILSCAREHPPDRNNLKTYACFIGLSALAGFLFFTALITSTTVLLVLFIVAVYTFIQSIADFLQNEDPGYLLILNLVMLCCVMGLLLLFGFRNEGLSVTSYSPGLVLVHGAIMAETLALFILAKVFRGKRTHFFLALAALTFGGLMLSQIIPAFQQISSQAGQLVSGNSAFSVGVQETLPWSISGAFDAINVAILLVAGGFLVLAHLLVTSRRREIIFVAIWSIIMLVLTIRFQRFLYYFTVNIVLLSALCVTEPLRWDMNSILGRIPFIHTFQSGRSGEITISEKQPVTEKTGKKKKVITPIKDTSGIPDTGKLVCLVVVGILTITFIGLSLSKDIQYGLNAKDREIPPDWLDSLEWIRITTPDPGIGYFEPYEKSGYTAPSESYGILAVWDAGHWITFFSHRLPVTNPFQDNLGGSSGTAAFFLNENETKADDILKKFHGRYVITDSTMAVDRFTNLVPWVSGSTDISPYIKWFLISDTQDTSHLKKIHLFDNAYFQTMIVRLHNFDGSMITPVEAEYVRYTIRQPTAQENADASGFSRVITNLRTTSLTGLNRNDTPIIAESPELLPTTYADFYSAMPDKPFTPVPALAHYRLIYESPGNATVMPFPESESFTLTGIKTVKVFEHVPGARIPGQGIIEVPLVTNTGRTFVYRQESAGAGFIVPYSTQGNPYSVHATGPYHIIGTSDTFEVTEEAVTQGLPVNG